MRNAPRTQGKYFASTPSFVHRRNAPGGQKEQVLSSPPYFSILEMPPGTKGSGVAPPILLFHSRNIPGDVFHRMICPHPHGLFPLKGPYRGVPRGRSCMIRRKAGMHTYTYRHMQTHRPPIDLLLELHSERCRSYAYPPTPFPMPLPPS